MKYIKAPWQSIRGWSQRMHISPANSITKYKYGVTVEDAYGYTPATDEALSEIDIEYTLVDEIPNQDVGI
jgi:hypothetical protein